jgi:hypothetical protein
VLAGLLMFPPWSSESDADGRRQTRGHARRVRQRRSAYRGGGYAGGRVRVYGCSPRCLLISLLLSVILTLLLYLLIRLF